MRAPTTEFKPVPENFDPSQNYVAKFDSLVSTAAASAPASCTTDSVTADCLRDLYGTYDYVPQATDKNLIGFAGFLEQYAIYADLRKFEQRERPDAYAGNRTFTTVLVGDGAMNNQSEPGVEANLDVQTIVGQTYPTPVDFYSTAGRPPFKADLQTPSNTNEPYAVLFEYLVGLPDNKLPKVVSLSYGDDEQTVPYDYALRVCGLIGALGARGVSMIHSSGDSGVGSTNASHCVSNDGKSKKTFLPTFPSTCPYATSVGATQAFAPEVAVDDTDGGYYGGGGFSNYFPIPGYQSSAVPSYIASLGSKYAGLYNKKGRGFPDVSAQGANYLIVSGGRFGTVGGTSASAPTFASVISLLNDARLAAGKRSLGFLNPLLYSKGTAGLNDITSGANAGCGVAGFPAQKGWDPATGLGTPNFPKLKEIVA